VLGNIVEAIVLAIIGIALLAYGHRWFHFLLPTLAFFLGLKAVTAFISSVIGQNFISSAMACVPGVLVGFAFAIFSHLFFPLAVLFWAGSVGFVLVAGLLTALGVNGLFIVITTGVIGAIVAVVLASRAGFKKYVPVVLTACTGATMILTAVLLLFDHLLGELMWSLNWGSLGGGISILSVVIFAALAIFGIGNQMLSSNRSLTVDTASLEV
jgi:hypothetical protein